MQEGAELRQRYMRAAGGPTAFPVGNTGELGHGPARRQLEAPHHFRLFFPLAHLFAVLFSWLFSPRPHSQTRLLQLRRRPTNESVSRRRSGGDGKTRMDVCVTPASLLLPGMCKGRLPQPLPRRAEMRLRLGTCWTVSVQLLPFIPRLLLSLPSPHHSARFVTRRDRPHRGARARHPRPAAPSWAPALPLLSPAPASHRKMRAGQTAAPPVAHSGRGPSVAPRPPPFTSLRWRGEKGAH